MLSVDSIDLYYGAAQALRSVSMQAKPGRVMCVLGRNGVGKSSLLRAIVGHQKIASGAINWNGEPIQGLSPHARARKKVAYVPQGREIFPLLSVKENLDTGFAPIPRKDRFVPEEIFELFPVLTTMLGRRGGVYTLDGRMDLAGARFKRDFQGVDEEFGGYVSENYSRAYIHHLLKAKEFLAGTLCTMHNLEFMIRLVDNIRAAIDAGDYEAYRDEFLGRYYAGSGR